MKLITALMAASLIIGPTLSSAQAAGGTGAPARAALGQAALV